MFKKRKNLTKINNVKTFLHLWDLILLTQISVLCLYYCASINNYKPVRRRRWPILPWMSCHVSDDSSWTTYLSGVVLQYLIWHFYRNGGILSPTRRRATMVGGRLRLLGGDENGVSRRAVVQTAGHSSRTDMDRAWKTLLNGVRESDDRTAGASGAYQRRPLLCGDHNHDNGVSGISLWWRITQLHSASRSEIKTFRFNLFNFWPVWYTFHGCWGVTRWYYG